MKKILKKVSITIKKSQWHEDLILLKTLYALKKICKMVFIGALSIEPFFMDLKASFSFLLEPKSVILVIILDVSMF